MRQEWSRCSRPADASSLTYLTDCLDSWRAAGFAPVAGDMLDRLATGNRLLLPDRACALLDRAAELGLPADFLATCQGGLILAKALVRNFDDFLTQIEDSFDDAQYLALLKRSWEASAWKPHDPRVEELATAIANHLLAHPKLVAISSSLQGNTAIRYGLINDHQARVVPPTGARLSALIEAKLRAARINRPHETSTAQRRDGRRTKV